MKLQVLSDIHVDHWAKAHGKFWWDRWLRDTPLAGVDALVLAGDAFSLHPRDYLWTKARLTELVDRWHRVIYVPGNHEYYGTSITQGLAMLSDLAAEVSGLVAMGEGQAVELLGHRFVGGTMFQPEMVPMDPASLISDHKWIRNFTTGANAHYQGFMDFVQRELRLGDVLITHHAGSIRSLHPDYVGHPANHWFITPELETVILQKRPALYIHGHVHSPWDYVLGDTRVVCNPAGYPGENVTHNPQLVVELD